MEPISAQSSKVILLLRDDIDTDQIVPARFLKRIGRSDFADTLFADLRTDQEGRPYPDFVLNDPAVQDRRFLLTGINFGCGSSREHAVWALLGWGIRAVISPGFADIFRTNALKNGLLPVTLTDADHSLLVEHCVENPELELTVDLQEQNRGCRNARSSALRD